VVHDQVVNPLLGGGHHDLVAVLADAVQGVHGVEHFGGIANDEKDFVHGRSLLFPGTRTRSPKNQVGPNSGNSGEAVLYREADRVREAAPPSENRMAFIDAHVHVWTPDVHHYPLAAGFKKEDMKPASFTPEELFKHTKPAGVNRINLIQMSFYGTDNRYMLDMIALYPDVFVGTAVIDPHGEAPDQQMAELAKKSVRAFRIHPRLSKQPPARELEPAGYGKMFPAGAKNNQAMSCLIDPDGLPEVDRMCRQFRDTPVIIDHLCRIGANGTIADKDVEALCALANHPR